ncbi:hypothetical protein [Embleya hyalina]|uniref:hypothetical protein n=1 Tax=Embleya hyalina TaxID=516124 RepID=UPI000F82E9A4|nr:hypothetical protein [Embleya hyalina]
MTRPEHGTVFVKPAPTEENLVELAARHGPDKAERLPAFRFRPCTAVFLDGPRGAGQTTPHATDELGSLDRISTAGHAPVHEPVELAEADRPGKLLLVECDGRPVNS